MVNTGTWVRIPGPLKLFLLFCLTLSHAVHHSVIHHTPSVCACHVSLMVNPVAITSHPLYASVKRSPHDSKSQQRASFCWAKIHQATSSIGVNTPHGLHIVFFLFIFLFVLFILINSSKTIFIKPKKIRNHKIKIYLFNF